MINRADAFWAWVWDGIERPKNATQRFVIECHDDGSCLTVIYGDEKNFLDNRVYSATGWYHYERITEPKKRLMTREEILGFIAWNPHIVVRWEVITAQLPRFFDFTAPLDTYEWSTITEAGEIGEWSKFYKEVEE